MKGKKHHEDREHEEMGKARGGRHCRAAGGGVQEGVKADDKGPSVVYAGDDSPVVKSARELTSKFKKGGSVKMKKHGGCAEGGKPAARADRAPRKARASGGPLSTAAVTSKRPGGDVTNIG